MFASRQNGSRKPGEARAGTYFQEYPRAVGVQLLHHRGEFYGRSELPGEDLAHPVGGVRVGGPGFICVNPGLRLVELNFFQLSGEFFLRPRHQRAVESGRDLERGILHRAPGEAVRGSLYFFGAPGQHELGRGVLVGYNEVELFLFHDFFDIGQGGLHRQHPAAVAFAARHQAAAGFREREQRGHIENARGAQRRQLAVAVPGESVGGQAEAGQDPVGGQLGRAKRGLRYFGVAQFVRLGLFSFRGESGPGVDEVGQRLVPAELLVGGAYGVQRRGEAADQVALHAGVLGSLAGEQHGQLFRSAGGEEDPVRGRPGFIGLLRIQVGKGGSYDISGVLFPALEHESQARGVGGLERRAGAHRFYAQAVPVQAFPGSKFALQSFNIGARQRGYLHVAVPVRLQFFGRVFFEHGVEICAAEAHGAYAGPARVVFLYPRAELGVKVERSGFPGQLLQGGVDFYGGGQGLVVEREGRLDDAG